MSDTGIKKVIVSKDKLGTVGKTNEYVVRYRVVSEDKNRSSFWSPNYTVLSSLIDSVDGDVTIKTNSVDVIWDNSLQISAFDVFVAFNSSSDNDLKWSGTTTGNTYSFIKTGVLPVRVVVQVKSIGDLVDGSFYKQYNSDLVLYDSGQVGA
jgi:hypothetical protein